MDQYIVLILGVILLGCGMVYPNMDSKLKESDGNANGIRES